jgi:hypothetical protein
LQQLVLTNSGITPIFHGVSETDPKDPSIQMRALRWALGRNFKPITSEQLADMINIPPVAIRAVENRRRKFNADDRENIEILLGAVWNDESNQWITIWDGTPYTREKFEFYLSDEFLKRTRHLERVEYHKMVDAYLDRLTPARSGLALSKLYRELHRIAERDHVSWDEIKLEALKRMAKPEHRSSQPAR